MLEGVLHPRTMYKQLGWQITGERSHAITYDKLLDHAEQMYWNKRSKPTKRAAA